MVTEQVVKVTHAPGELPVGSELLLAVREDGQGLARLVSHQWLFANQTQIIHDINKELSPTVFNNFVPNYKSLATIAQLFSHKTSPKDQVILENTIIHKMISNGKSNTDEPIDNIVYTTFVDKFNKKYDSDLLEEQKELLMHYVSSFTDNAVALKVFLNEEIGRLKSELTKGLLVSEIQQDGAMHAKATKIIERLQEFSKRQLDDDVLLTVLKTQSLVKEINDGNKD